jgi:molybdate transport system ATP-binding protein
MAMQFLSMQQVTARYINNILLKNISLDIRKGENWALIGESGSGKSALLQTIAGRFNVTGGEVKYHFFDDFLKDNPANDENITHQKLIAFVEAKHHFRNLSNTTDFYYQQRYNSSDSEDALTVDEYLASIEHVVLQNQYWDLPKVIETMHLESLLNKQIIKLSNGETKRLRIAAALMKNPALLMLDAPLTGLDVQTRAEFNTILGQIIGSGITVIMATSPYEIPDGITDIAILKDGEIVQTLKKIAFDPAKYIMGPNDATDRSKLQALLDGHTEKTPYRYIVKMNKVNIRYGDKVILDNVNWQIVPGERWALLGPNGAGKSTLLSLINGDNPQAYANDIVLFDKKRGTGESIWDIKKKIGFVSPELHQYFPTENSCLQVIESGYYDTLGLFRPTQKAKADTALNWMQALEIEKYARNLLKNVPASVQRLCLLARALIKNPDLLIFDEPCQGMDAHQQLHFKNIVNTICEMSNVTLIYVTHYQQEIPDSVTKVLRLEKGKVVG